MSVGFKLRPVHRSTIALLFFALTACAKAQTTPPGKLGQVDLTTRLPEGIKKGSEDPTKEHERSAEICGEHAPGVKVVVRWETFSQKDNAYISSYEVELAKPQEGVAVKLGEPQAVRNANKSENDPYVSATTVVLTCNGEPSKSARIEIRADGTTK